MMSKKAKSGSQKRKEKRQERDRKRNEGKQLLTDFFPKKVSETVTEGDAAATDPSSTDTVDLRQEGSVQVDREDVIEDDGNEGSESREGSEESERDEERSESSQGSAKEYMPLPEDPVLWPEKLTNEERDTIVRRLASKEKTNKITAKDKEGKPFPNYLQFAKSANGREKIKRDWLIYSESAEALYCIPCLLFSHELKKPSRSALNSNDGMKISHMKWQRMYRKLPEHETNMPHKECYLKWKSLQHSLLSGTGVGHIQKQIQTEIEKNRIILERLLDVTLHLASRNLPFRGKTSNLGDVHNGNFLGTLELLAHYDSVLEEHLEKLRQKKEGSRLTHYLSPETQNEFIDICGKRVLNTILAERETAIYYSVICDSTPDISHIFLLTVWVKVLQCIENRNLILQTGDISLDSQAANIKDLQEEIQAICNKWDSLLTEASLVAQAMEIPAQFRSEERRKRKRKLMPDERRSEDETECSAEQAFRNNVFFVAIDSIISDLSERFQTTATLCESFAPLLRLGNMSEEQIKATCRALTRTYPKDLTVEFENEMLLLKTVYNATFAHNLSPLKLLNAIYKLQLQSIFGETCIALRIFCTLPVMVAGGERAFSKMKLVKNYLRSTMSQDRLNSLALLSIESQFSRKLDFKDLIKDFAIKKTRQWALTGV